MADTIRCRVLPRVSPPAVNAFSSSRRREACAPKWHPQPKINRKNNNCREIYNNLKENKKIFYNFFCYFKIIVYLRSS